MNRNLIIYNSFNLAINLNNCTYFFLFLIFFTSCNKDKITLKAVSYAQFESFINETGYITDAEKFGWSIVQLDVYNYTTSENATWKIPDGINKVVSGALPVTQVSYNDALSYCKWAKKRLPSYDEYWDLVKNDKRIIVYDNKFPISEIDTVNIVGNVWDITKNKTNDKVRLAGGSLFCSENTCHGTIKERELFVDKETGNINIGFSVIDL
ncbi:MAG: SUMF1/EgtB/PvdO family nonheme iron enzyme [Maribacter sp.]